MVSLHLKDLAKNRKMQDVQTSDPVAFPKGKQITNILLIIINLVGFGMVMGG